MDYITYGLIGAAWLACGLWAYRIEKAEFPHPVAPGADELFSAVLLLSGPAGLAAAIFMGAPDRRK